MTGLRFPSDLAAWRRWESRRHGVRGMVRRARARVRPTSPAPATLYLPTGTPTALVVMDNLSPSCRAVVHEPLAYADTARVAVLAAGDPALPGGPWTPVAYAGVEQLPTSVTQVLSLGAFNSLSEPVAAWCRRRDARFCVAQHGLMTPWAPPLNDGAHLLAWSEADAHFWGAQRPSITWEVVGSQMLHAAGQGPRAVVTDERPVVLGQLHGIELSRLDKLQTYAEFCLREGADYRPHPVERDAMSRAGHRWLRARGVSVVDSDLPLAELGRPVVSIFSTGTLEAAQRGLPAWVIHRAPAPWLTDFWNRYGLRPFGGEPTPAWRLGAVPPAARIAAAIGL